MADEVMRVAAWQCRPGPLDVEGNLRRLDSACARAASERAQVLVTPEMFTSGYGLSPDEVARLAEDPGGPVDTAVAEIARRHGVAIAYGHPSRVPDGANRGGVNRGGVYNTATLVGADGVVRGRHRKVHLFGDIDRSLFAAAPSAPEAFDFDGVRVGMLICYDVEFPEAVRRLAVSGARVMLVPTANMKGFEEVQEFLVRARACENGRGVVYANYCGADDMFGYNGLSLICGPDGSVLARACASGEELIVADVPLSSAGTYLADRRAGLYDGFPGKPAGRR